MPLDRTVASRSQVLQHSKSKWKRPTMPIGDRVLRSSTQLRLHGQVSRPYAGANSGPRNWQVSYLELWASRARPLRGGGRFSLDNRPNDCCARYRRETAVGRVLQFALAPDSRRSGRPPGHDAGAATVERLRSPSARRFRARHRPRCRGTPPSIPAWSARVAVERHAGFSCAGRSAVP